MKAILFFTLNENSSPPMFTEKELAENSQVEDAFVIQIFLLQMKSFFKKRAYETTLYLESLG